MAEKRINPRRQGRVGGGFFSKVLNDPNPLIRYGFAALMFFGPLYLMSSYGFKSAGIIAVAAFLGIIVYRQRNGGLQFQ